jgi:SAM-dependent methyltransferase
VFILDQVNRVLEGAYAGYESRPRIVLDAGGGSLTHVRLPPAAVLVALDLSRGQLERNLATPRRVQADLHHLPFARACLDMVICFNVLEHLADPERALDQIVESLRPEGLLVLACPDRWSLKGLLTRLLPAPARRMYYRIVVGKRDRGEQHYDVFDTRFGSVVSRAPLRRGLAWRGMEILFHSAYDGAAAFGLTTGDWKRRVVAAPYYWAGWLGRLLTLGAWGALDSDLMFVARKHARPRGEPS